MNASEFGHAEAMPRRTRTDDAQDVERADDLNRVVQDKRAGRRADAARGRRRNRRYQNRLTHMVKRGAADSVSDGDDS